MRKNTVMDLSYASAIRIINLGKTLQVEKKNIPYQNKLQKVVHQLALLFGKPIMQNLQKILSIKWLSH